MVSPSTCSDRQRQTDLVTITVTFHIWFAKTHKHRYYSFSLTHESSGCLVKWPAVKHWYVSGMLNWNTSSNIHEWLNYITIRLSIDAYAYILWCSSHQHKKHTQVYLDLPFFQRLALLFRFSNKMMCVLKFLFVLSQQFYQVFDFFLEL